MDDILIPFQNGQEIAFEKVALFLSALLAAALAGWALGWARTYLLALVSERMGADLRTTTYEHLLTLPLDYFGGKRTGDLMARIGSETDRINVFLSLHALDFLTDVIMIGMTAVILVSINSIDGTNASVASSTSCSVQSAPGRSRDSMKPTSTSTRG